MSTGMNWARTVSQQMKPQQEQKQPAQQTMLSNKVGLSQTKKTALQQGIVSAIAQPQFGQIGK